MPLPEQLIRAAFDARPGGPEQLDRRVHVLVVDDVARVRAVDQHALLADDRPGVDRRHDPVDADARRRAVEHGPRVVIEALVVRQVARMQIDRILRRQLDEAIVEDIVEVDRNDEVRRERRDQLVEARARLEDVDRRNAVSCAHLDDFVEVRRIRLRMDDRADDLDARPAGQVLEHRQPCDVVDAEQDLLASHVIHVGILFGSRTKARRAVGGSVSSARRDT
ncbi:hypothetical protein Y046_3813 [Burkholderia pseudomallei MSHR2990]|nr:hypothetical protein Y046_3813 [Burkholderia pseudomallei MSHR2990]